VCVQKRGEKAQKKRVWTCNWCVCVREYVRGTCVRGRRVRKCVCVRNVAEKLQKYTNGMAIATYHNLAASWRVERAMKKTIPQT